MDLLFRPVFIRARTPVIGASFPESFSLEGDIEADEIAQRIRPSSRVSSYISFRASTLPISAPEAFPHLRNPDNVYHQPSVDQLAEMLKVIMMNQSTMEPVPVEYNSTILHVLEAYQDLRMGLERREEEIGVLRESHGRDIGDFEDLAREWERREGEYKAEMKKLEVLLAKTEGGLESVALARSKSVLHGAEQASESISRGIGTIKARDNVRNSQNTVTDVSGEVTQRREKTIIYKTSFQMREDRDLEATVSFAARRGVSRKRSTLDSLSRPERSHLSEVSLPIHDTSEISPHGPSPPPSDHERGLLTKTQLEALERQHAQEIGLAFESSTESGSTISHQSAFPSMHGSNGLGIDLSEKPLPEIPIIPDDRTKQTTLHRFLHGRKHSYSDPNEATGSAERRKSYHIGFSFRPGDDDLLSRRVERDRSTRRTVDEHLEQQPSPLRPADSKTNTQASVAPFIPKKKELVRPTINLVTARASQLPRVQDHDNPSRMGSSSSSVVTAVRHDSGRSSESNSQAGRPKLKRDKGSGSSEAVSAAARAFANNNNKRSPTVSRKGSLVGSVSGSLVEPRNRVDGDGRRSLRGSRTSSVASGASALDGGSGKKPAVGTRRVEKKS